MSVDLGLLSRTEEGVQDADVLVLQQDAVVVGIPLNCVEQSNRHRNIFGCHFCPFWYVPTSSAVPTTCPSMALRSSALEGLLRSGSTMSSA